MIWPAWSSRRFSSGTRSAPRTPKPSRVSEHLGCFGQFAFNELVKNWKVVQLPKSYFEKTLPAFAYVITQFPRHLMKILRDGRFWGLTGYDLDLWNLQMDMIIDILVAHGVNVDIDDTLFKNMAEGTDAEPGT